ncbi:hypothetical protein JCM8208_006512 [Rhodotorula glutinis]
MQGPDDRYRSPPPSHPSRPPGSYHPPQAVRPLPSPQLPSPPRNFSPSSPPAPSMYSPYSPHTGSPSLGNGHGAGSGFRPQPPRPPTADERWRSASGSSQRWQEPHYSSSAAAAAHDERGAQGYRRREGSSPLSPASASQGRIGSPLPPLPPRMSPYSPPPPPASAPPLPARYSPSRERSSRSPSAPSPGSPTTLPPGAFCTATSDLESLVVVPLGSVSSAAAIRDLVLSRLHIADEDAPRHAFHLTRIGAGEGHPTSDAELWDAVRQSAAGEGPQVTVFVKEVVPRRDNASPETGRSAAEYASGLGRREREQREREMSGSRRGSSPTARHRSPSLVGDLDEFGARRDGGLRSDHTRWPSGSGGSHHGSRQTSASSVESSRVVASPQSLGQMSPPIAGASPIAGSTGFRTVSGSSGGLKTSPDDYFHVPVPHPPQPRSAQSSPNPGAGAGSYQPQPQRVQQYTAQPPQVVMGPSGPTRRLPPQPQAPQQDVHRAQTVPGSAVSSPGWQRTVQAPHKQITVPLARPPTSSHAHGPTSTSRGGPDPRINLPQYGSQPYRNLPLPAGQSPYHNLSLQNQFSSVEYINAGSSSSTNLPPRAATLAVQSAGRMASKSVDNLRLPGPSAGYPGAPPQASAAVHASSAFRSPPGPSGHPGAAGSRPYQQPQQPQLPQPPQPPVYPHDLAASSLSSAPSTPVPSSASAFYSAPVQAQHAASAAARGPPVPRRPVLEQAHSQPVPGPAGARPMTMQDIATSSSGWTREQDGQRRRAETVDHVGEASPAPEPSAPAFADDDGAYDGLAADDRLPSTVLPQQQHRSASTSTSASPPSSASAPLTPASDSTPLPAQPAAPKLVDEFGDSLDEETSTWFPVGQQQVQLSLASATAPSPGQYLQQPQASAPRLLDEFGDPLDEETSTWFPVNQSATSTLPSLAQHPPPQPPSHPQPRPAPALAPKLVDEFGDDLDEDSSTWFPVNQPALPSFPPRSAAPTPPPPSASAPPAVVAVPTTAVPAPSSYGTTSSPMRRQTSASSASDGGSGGPSPASGGGAVPRSAGASSDKRDSIPDAQDWTQTILSRFGAGTGAPAGGEDGTLLAGAGTGTLRAVAPSAPASAASTPKVVDEFGDDVEDESTFFPGHGPSVPSPLGRASSLGSRPSLRLKIDTPTPPLSTTPMPSVPPVGAHGRRSASANGESDAAFAGAIERLNLAGRGSTPVADVNARKARVPHPRLDDLVRVPTSPFARRNSFAAREHDQDWAFRPPVETVLEHLDVFFPEHDLDKPVFDAPTPGPSTPPTSSSSPTRDAPPPSSAVTPSTLASRRAAHLGYRKSIRVVAQDRKRMLQKAGNNVARAASGLASNLLRRKSTKLFGARIEEVTSAQMKQIGAIKQASDEDPENFSYKWIKGDLIGRGTYGHVYIALSVTTGETIAVKQVEMPRSFSDKEDQRTKGMISSLKAEIELLKDLDHPNIVLYLGMEQTPEFLSIFLEYVPGGSIGRIIRTHGKFEENVIKFFTLQILDGLEYLHSLGILHRDMKADNILIDQDGMCKISDFGTSKKSGDIYQNNENMSMQGSIFWMAPEVIHNNKQGYSAKADIWSLGCICIEMLAGSRPWEGEGFMSAMFKLGAERMRPPLPPDVQISNEAEQFVSACLQIEADARPTAVEAKHDSFLTSLDPSFAFTSTSLWRIMAADELSRAHKPSTPSNLGA